MVDNKNTKICLKCGIDKELTCFYSRKDRKNGARSSCKECEKKLNKEYILKNPNKRKETNKKCYDNHYKNNKEYYTKRNELFYLNNPLYFKESNKKFKDKNPEYKKKYEREKRKKSPLYKLELNMRKRLWEILKSKKILKKDRTFIMVGESFSFLKEYLEKKFLDGMSWENYGEWHVDHIIPLCSVNTEEELKKLFHYTNLQPLWANDNIKKGKKILWQIE
jgi:hypothetical protein